MKQLHSIAVAGVTLCTTFCVGTSAASAQMARREAARPTGIAAAQMRTPAERLMISRALLDSARQSLAAGEIVLRAGDVGRANLRFAAARALRAAIVPDQSLASELSAMDAALKRDAEAAAIGDSMLANADIPPVPTSSGGIPIAPAVTETRAVDRPPVATTHAADASLARATPVRAATRWKSPRRESPARAAALDSAAEQNRRALATSVDVTAPTPGLDEIGGRVLTVRTFESPSPAVAFGARKYARTFETATARYLYTEVSIGFVSEATMPDVELTCKTRLGDSTVVEQPVHVSHERDASVFLVSFGIGWGVPNRLEPGTYVTTCTNDDTPVLVDSFAVTGTTAHSAYVAGESSAQAGVWTDAADAYASAVRLDSTVAEYHFAHGIALERLHDDSAAIDEYAVAVRLAPDALRYHLQYAGVLHHLRRLDDAVGEYREVIRLDSADARRHMALADLLLENGDRVGALLEYRTAAEMDASEPYYAMRVTELTRRK